MRRAGGDRLWGGDSRSVEGGFGRYDGGVERPGKERKGRRAVEVKNTLSTPVRHRLMIKA